MKALRLALALVLAVCALAFLAGCDTSGSDDDGDSEIVEDSTVDGSASNAGADATGTREDPLAIGTAVQEGPFEITLTEADTGTDGVVASFEFESVSGETEAEADFTYEFVDSDGVSHVFETIDGDFSTGYEVVFSVPPGKAEGGLVMMRAFYVDAGGTVTDSGPEVFWSVD